jgi:hypothetical protein
MAAAPPILSAQRDLSRTYGAGASSYDETALADWRTKWDDAAAASKRGAWRDSIACLEDCVQARPDFAKGYVPLSRAYGRAGNRLAVRTTLQRGLEACAGRGGAHLILDEIRKIEAQSGGTSGAVLEAAEAADAAAAPMPPVAGRQSSLPSAAAESLLAAGFERSGWAWHHAPTGTMVIEASDGGQPEVYNSGLAQCDIDERVALSFAASAWDDGFGRRLVRWVADAIVLDGAAPEAVGLESAPAADDEGAVDVGLSRLPTAERLGATATRRLRIHTWGDKVVGQLNLERECGCRRHFNAKPLNGRGGGANLKLNATQDSRIVRNVCSSMQEGEGLEWLRRVVRAIEERDEHSVSVFCSQGRHRSVSAALILRARYYPEAEMVHVKMR